MKGFINFIRVDTLEFLWQLVHILVYFGLFIFFIDAFVAGRPSEGFAFGVALMCLVIASGVREKNIVLKEHLNEVILMCERQQKLLDMLGKELDPKKRRRKK